MKVTLDLESPENTASILRMGGHKECTPAQCVRAEIADQIEAQIPKPKPPEPTGLGAVVVEDFNEAIHWVRVSTTSAKPWLADGLLGKRLAWSGLDDAVRVLSPGVE